MRELIELRCTRELALKLGCIEPDDIEQHKQMRASGLYLLARDPVKMVALFWLLQSGLPQ